jgi:two-component system, chemotaxis family, chemotaxis protein CheY
MALDPSMPVLVVDDYGTMVRIIHNLLRQLGFSDVDDANDGAAALAKMHAKRYGLVISDWNMEPMSGYDLLREVRADPALGQTPFIMVTARATENVSLWPIVFSNSGSGCQALYDHPCRAHCSLRGRGVPSA